MKQHIPRHTSQSRTLEDVDYTIIALQLPQNNINTYSIYLKSFDQFPINTPKFT